MHLAETVVERRYPALVRDYALAILTAHVAALLRHHLFPDRPRPCGNQDVELITGRGRWADVHQDLTSGDPHTAADPKTVTAWRARGLTLTGQTRQEQLASLLSLPQIAASDEVTAIFGTPVNSEGTKAISAAANRCSTKPDGRDRLAEALSHITNTDWLIEWLYPRPTIAEER